MTSAEDQLRVVREEAAVWFVRLQDADCPAEDWRAFQAWLEAHPAHADAYDEVEAAWVEIEPIEAAPIAAPAVADLAEARQARARRRPTMGWIWGGAIAASLAAAVLFAPELIAQLAPKPVAYATATGQTRAVTLADGSRLMLNSGTELAVTLTRQGRAVALTRGEASFDVAHDAKRPFTVDLGDRQVRVLGTEFDILRHQGRLTVTVRRGLVAVDPLGSGTGQAYRLAVGQQLTHAEGAPDSAVSNPDPDYAFAWKTGRLVYQDRPLGEVASDLGRYFSRPIHVDAAVASMRFTGVLFLDDQEAVVRRLEQFLPIRAQLSADEVRLSARAAP